MRVKIYPHQKNQSEGICDKITKSEGKNLNQKAKKRPQNAARVQGQTVFLTIPLCDQLEKVYHKLESKSKELLIEKFAVVLETHTNNRNKAKHLHVFVKFSQRRELCLGFFDFLGKHGKLEKVRNIEAVLQYMNKENVCKANFDVWKILLENHRTFASAIARMMIAGWTEIELINRYGSILAGQAWSSALSFGKKAVLADRAGRRTTSRMRQITREIIENRLSREELTTFDSDQQFRIFVDTINKILSYGNSQLHKQCCLSIVGKPSIGKSTVVNALKAFFRTYIFPLDGWHTQYDNGIYEIILWNEWDIKLLSRSDLLLFTEGEVVDLKVKYTKAVKEDRPMIIFTSNHTYVDQVNRRYGYDLELRDSTLEALSVRFVELNFGKTEIWFLKKLFLSVESDIIE